MSPSLWKLNPQNKLGHENMIRDVMSRNFELQEYIYDGHIGRDTLKEIKSTSWSEIKKGSDYIRAKHRGAEFLFSNFHLVRIRADEDFMTASSTVVFVGQWIILNLDRGGLSRMAIDENQILGDFPGLPHVEYSTDNKMFNNKFRILADDPKMVPTIATPAFIDNIMSIDQVTQGASKGKKLFFIQGRHMHIILHTKRYFFEANKLAEVPARVEADVNCIKHILDVLSLHSLDV